MGRFVLFQRILDRLTLPMRFIPRLGKKRLVPRSMAVWFLWQPSWKRVTRLKSSPIQTHLDQAVTGSIWLRPAKPVTKFVSSLKTKTKNCPSIKAVKCWLVSSKKTAMWQINLWTSATWMKSFKKPATRQKKLSLLPLVLEKSEPLPSSTAWRKKNVVKKSVLRLRQKQKNWSRVAKSR